MKNFRNIVPIFRAQDFVFNIFKSKIIEICGPERPKFIMQTSMNTITATVLIEQLDV